MYVTFSPSTLAQSALLIAEWTIGLESDSMARAREARNGVALKRNLSCPLYKSLVQWKADLEAKQEEPEKKKKQENDARAVQSHATLDCVLELHELHRKASHEEGDTDSMSPANATYACLVECRLMYAMKKFGGVSSLSWRELK